MKTNFAPTKPVRLLSFAAACAPLLLPFGCGGNSNGAETTSRQPSGTGRAVFHITWPKATSRLIPEASESVEIRVLDGENVLKTEILARPATELTIEDLPAKDLTNLVRAFPTSDASGVAQAEGRVKLKIKPDEEVEAGVTLDSTIERLEPSVTGTVEIGDRDTVALSASPRNKEDETVLIRPRTLRWTSSAPDIAIVDANGIVTAIQPGIVVIEAKEPESGKTAQFTVRVGRPGVLYFSESNSNVYGNDFVSGSGSVTVRDISDGSGDVPNLSFVVYDSRNNYSGGGEEVQVELNLPPTVVEGAVFDIGPNLRAGQAQASHDTRRLIPGPPASDVERWFLGNTQGKVRVEKIENRTYTLRLEKVRMHASRIDGSDATGSFVVNGTIIVTDTR